MEYGLVRRWAPHHGVGSFLPCTALVLSLSFSSGVFYEMLDVRSSSAISLGFLGASLHVLGGWALSTRALGP